MIVRRCADKFCLHCNIFIYIRRIWIKPVLCSPSYFTLNTQKLTGLNQCTSKWKSFQSSVQTACCYWILNRGESFSNWNSQTNASRLWWSVCWCEYSKTLGKMVQRWRIGASRFECQNTKWNACDGFEKLVQRQRKGTEVCGNFVEKWLYSFENNCCRHISFFFFYFIKISFPVHFLFKWRQKLPARPRIFSVSHK